MNKREIELFLQDESKCRSTNRKSHATKQYREAKKQEVERRRELYSTLRKRPRLSR